MNDPHLPRLGAAATTIVRAHVAGDVLGSLEKTNIVIQNILTRYGCPGCHSGLDIRFVPEDEYLVDAQTLNVTPVVSGQSAGF